jgi:hypothetical protein
MPTPNGGLRIIIANEPRAYREALVEVLKEMRPRDAVVSVEPGDVEHALHQLPGALVVCSEVSTAVVELAGAWVRLGEDGEVAVSSAADVEAMAHRVGLDAVLDAVEAAGIGLAQLL